MKLVAQALSAAAMPVGAENRVGGPELQATASPWPGQPDEPAARSGRCWLSRSTPTGG